MKSDASERVLGSRPGNDREVERVVVTQARNAKRAARRLGVLDSEARTRALEGVAAALRSNSRKIQAANALDLAAGAAAELGGAMLDRLRLDDQRVEALASSVEEVAALPDPVGEVVERWTRPNGLRVERVRIPLGVVAMIYESRPNVTSDAAALCFKAGNAVILRGGREAIHSNRAIARVIREALGERGVDPDAVQLIETTDREAVNVLLRQDAFVDLVIPRGGEGLIRTVMERSRIPVLKHYKGVCHVYVDVGADPVMAREIVLNAKVQRPGVCNAAETLLVHRSWAPGELPSLAQTLHDAGVELRGCPTTRQLLGDQVHPAGEEDWGAEYLDLILAVRVVEDLNQAVDHIARYGSDHTEAIVTPDPDRARRFVVGVASSTVLVNASTRFADGGELGLGAEIGISTSRLHAYGPMGARDLTAVRFVVQGEGQVRS